MLINEALANILVFYKTTTMSSPLVRAVVPRVANDAHVKKRTPKPRKALLEGHDCTETNFSVKILHHAIVKSAFDVLAARREVPVVIRAL
jgi:hypothetical protein